MKLTRWEYSKAKSNYHFDPFKNEDIDVPFKRVGSVQADLVSELHRLLMVEQPQENGFRNRLHVQLGRSDIPYTIEMDLEELKILGLPEDHSFFYNLPIEK